MLIHQITSRFFQIGISLLLIIQTSHSQTIEDYNKRWKLEKNQYAADGQEDTHFLEAYFNFHARAQDDEFSEFLSEPWHDYVINAGNEPEKSKTTGTRPVFKMSDLLTFAPPVSLSYSDRFTQRIPASDKRGVMPRVRKPEPDKFNTRTTSFKFYDNEIILSYDKLLLVPEARTVSEESAAAFWQQFARSNNNHLVDQLMDYRDLLGLGDWGYFCLVKEAATHINPENKWGTDLLSWALTLRSGFQVKLAYNQFGSTILFPCNNMIFSRQYILIDQSRYYLDTALKGSILATYSNNLAGASKVYDLVSYRSLNFKGPQVARRISFSWNDKAFEFNFHYNPGTIRFYKNYPLTEAIIYFESPISSRLKEELYYQFYPILSKMNKAEASAFLQQFVQEAFAYQSANSENVGDRFLFPDEVFAGKASNDKGHAVLYAWLIRNMVKLPVIGLEFPGFYSTAVCFDKPVDGDYYLWQGNKYIFVDPTFLKAPVGIIMPELASAVPKILDLKNSFADSEKEKHIWNLAIRMGAARGGNYRDIVIDNQGRTFITGYFNDTKNNLSKVVLHPFIACFSENNSLQWLRKFEGTGRGRGLAILKIDQDELFIAGSFRGELKMERHRLLTFKDQPDLFIAKFNQNGELIWIKKSGIDSLENDANLTYFVNFDSSGNNFYTRLINEDDRNVTSGLFDSGNNWIYFTGSRNGTTGMTRYSTQMITEPHFNILAEIYKAHTLLISDKCNPSIAGIVAVLHLLETPGAEIRGRQLQAILNQYNPVFSSLNPLLYNAIGQIELIRNENGIISILTVDQKPINLSGFKVNNNAHINLNQFGNGDISAGIISGIEVGAQGIGVSLNNLLIDISTGNMVFDYDNDHTLHTVNFNRSILKK